jgi:LPXTG-motif cell wall-anchored protein
MQNLAYDPFVPQLANTGASVGAGVAALAAALLGAGAIALFSRRRRTA